MPCLLGLICPLRVQIQFEPFGSLIFLFPSEELELCDLCCNTPHLSSIKNRNSGKKTANIHRKFTIKMCIDRNDYLRSFEKRAALLYCGFHSNAVAEISIDFLT